VGKKQPSGESWENHSAAVSELFAHADDPELMDSISRHPSKTPPKVTLIIPETEPLEKEQTPPKTDEGL